jgi:hypothetical protein
MVCIGHLYQVLFPQDALARRATHIGKVFSKGLD